MYKSYRNSVLSHPVITTTTVHRKIGGRRDLPTNPRYGWYPLIMTVLTRCEIVFVVTIRIAPLDIRLGEDSKITCRRPYRVRLMTITAFWNRLRILRIVRDVTVWSNSFPASRHMVGGCRGKFIERSVTIQATVLGGRHRRGVGLRCAGWSSGRRSGRLGTDSRGDRTGRHEQKHPKAQELKLSFHDFSHFKNFVCQ